MKKIINRIILLNNLGEELRSTDEEITLNKDDYIIVKGYEFMVYKITIYENKNEFIRVAFANFAFTDKYITKEEFSEMKDTEE